MKHTNVVATEEGLRRKYAREDHAQKVVDALNEHNVLPVSLDKKTTMVLNVLGLYTYFSGSLIGLERSAKGFINGGAKRQRDLSDIVQRELGLELDYKEERREWRFTGSLSGAYVRLLGEMGFHVSGQSGTKGRKAQAGSSLPPYLNTIISEFESLSKTCQLKLKRYVHDVVQVLANTRMQPSPGNRDMYITLPSQPTEEKFYHEASLIVKAFNIEYPMIEVQNSQASARPARNIWDGYLMISMEQILAMPRKTTIAEISVAPRLNPKLSFEDYRLNR